MAAAEIIVRQGPRRLWLWSGALVLAGVVGGGFWWWQAGSAREAIAEPPPLPAWQRELELARSDAQRDGVGLLLCIHADHAIRFTGEKDASEAFRTEIFADDIARLELEASFRLVELTYDTSDPLSREQEDYAPLAMRSSRDHFDGVVGSDGVPRGRTTRSTFTMFPEVVLTDADGRPWAVANPYRPGQPQAWLGEITELQRVRQFRDEGFAAASRVAGRARAEALARGLDAMSDDIVGAYYATEAREIIALDSDRAAGLADRFDRLLQWHADLPVVREMADILGQAMETNDVTPLRAALTKIMQAHPDRLTVQQWGKACAAFAHRGEADLADLRRELQDARAMDPTSKVATQIDGWLRQLEARRPPK